MMYCYTKPEKDWIPITQQDVARGTYRILSCGCYYLAENIEFAPNIECCDYWPDTHDPPFHDFNKDTQKCIKKKSYYKDVNAPYPVKRELQKPTDPIPGDDQQMNPPTETLPPDMRPLYPMGPYALGFFAAITIEADDVVLDLNGKNISASLPMQLKQVRSSVTNS